ncbi:solute carrier family 23 protein [Nesterenkonia sp. CL21]|uniref:uracil-xanthine permease family protein n=1 Tax=Nesterenkonia sp. CL21 TaxID=3064894 RepID=UPI0028791658|nr:solute carrier family 23 protein [Nesterenkonia sp. CL21]MDS2173542.1 solute carrier family 23 protein [Nesterenkonia sp. CL21]
MPPLRRAVPLAVQHFLAMFVGNAAPPLIVATAIGMAAGEVTLLVQLAMIVSGATTLLQTLGVGPVGSRLPVMQGTSFAFLVVAIPIAEQFGIAAVFGGAFIAGLVQVVFGMSLRWLTPLFPPLVCGIIILIIGLKLMPTAIDYSAGGAAARAAGDFGALHHFGVAALVIVVSVVCHQFGRGLVSVAAVLIGLLSGYAAAAVFGMVSLAPVTEARWLFAPAPMHFGLDFTGAAIIAITVLALASSVESIGDLTAVARTGLGRSPRARELSGGVMADGVGTSLGAVLGAMPNTTFSQNTGIIALSGVVSRYVVALAGGLLVLAGFVPKVAAVFNTVPYAVLGGSVLVMFSMVASAGIQVMAPEMIDRRSLLIVALSLGLGVGLSFAPEEAVAAFPADVALLLTSGIVPAMLAAVILNAVLPGRRQRRSADRDDQSSQAPA